MLKHVRFKHNGVDLYTILGDSFTMSQFPYSNAVPMNKFSGNPGIMNALKRSNSNLETRKWPFVDVEEIHEIGTYFHMKGTFEYEGNKYNVELSQDECVVTPVVVETVPVTEVEEPTPVVEEPTPVVEEPMVIITPRDVTVETEEVASTVEEEPAVVEPFPIIEPLEEEEVVEEVVDPDSIVPEVPDSHFAPGKTSRNFVRFGALPANPAAKITVPPVDKPAVVLPQKETSVVGCKLNLDNKFESGIHLGTDKPATGITFGPLRSHSIQKPSHVVRAEKEAQRAARRQIEEEKQAAEAKRLQEAWNNTPANGFTYNVPTPAPTEFNPEMPEEEPVVETPVDEVVEENTSSISREEAKAAVRAELPKEINDVIGHIPINMLGSIAECTYQPVDTVELAQKRNMYCIDHRWYNQGKWFCVDVIPNVSRYFYNAKLGISVEIPINVCKAWLNALSV